MPTKIKGCSSKYWSGKFATKQDEKDCYDNMMKSLDELTRVSKYKLKDGDSE